MASRAGYALGFKPKVDIQLPESQWLGVRVRSLLCQANALIRTEGQRARARALGLGCDAMRLSVCTGREEGLGGFRGDASRIRETGDRSGGKDPFLIQAAGWGQDDQSIEA